MAASSVSFGRLEAWQVGTEREPGLRCSPALVSSSRERRIGKRFRAEVDYRLFYERELVGS